jgi:hypothetical protein
MEKHGRPFVTSASTEIILLSIPQITPDFTDANKINHLLHHRSARTPLL